MDVKIIHIQLNGCKNNTYTSFIEVTKEKNSYSTSVYVNIKMK